MQQSVTMSTNIPHDAGRKAKADLRETARAGATYHATHHIKKHFQSGAATRYGYKPRSKSYQRLKQRLTGQTLPLVFTGRTRDEATDPSNQQVTATSTRGAKLRIRVSLSGLSGSLRRKAGQRFLTRQQEQQLARKAELEAFTSDEVDAIADAEERFYAARVAERQPVRKLT